MYVTAPFVALPNPALQMASFCAFEPRLHSAALWDPGRRRSAAHEF